jgi:CRISPR-associated protein (TIGR03986 family)
MNERRVGSLSELGKLGFESKSPVKPAPAGKRERESVRIRRSDRAGRAPYNFVPLAADHWPKVDPPAPHDRFDPALLSGRIEIELRALTDFYIRGMWSLPEYMAGRELNQQSAPFQVDRQLRLPGSSIRGMVRMLVEILGKAPIDPVNNDQLFFRAVASTDNPENLSSFEPQAVAYKSRMVKGVARDIEAAARVGFLYGSREGWAIRPAHSARDGRQWYRIATEQIWTREKIRFIGDGKWATRTESGREGWLICSGRMMKKRHQWVIEAEDSAAPLVAIPADDVRSYEEAGISQEIRKRRFEYGVRSSGVPCFYVKWKDSAGVEHVSFGHTPYFRLPYRNTTQVAIPGENSRGDRTSDWDLAQAIFGRVPAGKSAASQEAWKGRVSFMDGMPAETGGAANPEREIAAVLNGPKPTTYQHYLVQTSEEPRDIVHWDGNWNGDPRVLPTIRGHKLYWHRPNAPIQAAGAGQENVATKFRPGKAGCRFTASIAFRNLRPVELGVLLTALELPEGCAHKLGMAKPLGFGSVAVTLNAVQLTNFEQRYSCFLAGPGQLSTGRSKASAAQIGTWKSAFAAWYLNRAGDWGELWRESRLRELKALLTWEGLPEHWASITRPLEFGQIPGYGQYNEYQWVGYPGARPQLSKRRPLPPATQVLEAGPAIPKDPRPPFSDETRDRGPREPKKGPPRRYGRGAHGN